MDIQHIKKYVPLEIKDLKCRLFINMLYLENIHFVKLALVIIVCQNGVG